MMNTTSMVVRSCLSLTHVVCNSTLLAPPMSAVPRTSATLLISSCLRLRNHLVSKVCVGPRVISDHHPVLCVLDLHPPRWLTKKLLTRSLKSIAWDKFATTIANLPLLTAPSDNLDGLVEQYNNGLRAVLDLHAPVRTRTVTLRPVNRWMKTEILDTKTKLRHF